ncbi:hypothetical protein CCAX7_48810 [Capsulimonas corticalis]|uniref:Uncharacterized protein n=1 Tax=Capsulimonas corticalis TaxID=2219043 RepID=A0A402CQ71_9BACT|nr:hypothetical protein [Capsulimonas corticalis]BDI32830.1 hypothetical protein CCAX7_48810 [Capsulimonas corticalis]
MKRNLLTCIAAAALAVLPIATGAAPRALWVWNTAAIRQDPANQAKFFQFLAAPRGDAGHAIKTIYFDGMQPRDFQDAGTVSRLRAFITAAHHKRLRVDFLCGDPSWATAQGQPEGLRNLTAILNYNKSSNAAARYDGFQYDVEPYTLTGPNGWPSMTVQNGLVDLLGRSHAMIRASGQRVILSQAIPRWFTGAQFGLLGRLIMDQVDEVAVMDYVTTVEQMVGDPAEILSYASSKHKGVWIGVETNPLGDTPRATFYGSGNTVLERELAEALPKFKAQPSFRGYAIHDYIRYQTLKP